MSGKTLSVDIVLEREVYHENRKARIDEFRATLTDVNSYFAVQAIVKMVLWQEDFIAHIAKNGHSVARIKDEEKVLAIMVAEAQKVLGDKYGETRQSVLSDRQE